MKVKSVKRIKEKYVKHDIQTKNNNFIANGVVVHNSNIRMVYIEGQQYCGSRNLWKKDSENSQWWKCYKEIPGIKAFCEANEGCVLWGELYGKVGKFTYGQKDWSFAAFDIMRPDGSFMDSDELVYICKAFKIPMAPIEHESVVMPIDDLPLLAEGKSMLANHVREGVVIRPVKERKDRKGNRVILKIVGNGYLMKE